MTCNQCEIAQEGMNPSVLFKYNDAPFIIVACPKHIVDVMVSLHLKPDDVQTYGAEGPFLDDVLDVYPCKDCVDFMKKDMVSYYRVGVSNVEFLACSKHLKVVYDAMNGEHDRLQRQRAGIASR